MFDSVSKPMIRIVRSTGTRDAVPYSTRSTACSKTSAGACEAIFDEYDRNKRRGSHGEA